ncbi:MAG: ABC transporter permease [Caulobacteraceae bacterium]|nr:ABC transporter permease [Caulobacter sp.]
MRPTLPAWVGAALAALLPLAAALLASALVLGAFGADPLAYFGAVWRRAVLSPVGREAVLTRAAPLLLVAASLIAAFRAGFWNLGGDAQLLLGAVAASATAPPLLAILPPWLALLAGLVAGALAGAAWGLVPALLRAYQGINEVVTTLMMNFLGLSVANLLVKFVLADPATTVPQTATVPVNDRLPRLLGTTVTSGLLVGLAAVLIVQAVMARTAFGLKLRVVGLSPRAAVHAGLSVPGLTLASFAVSAGLAGLAGAVDVLGIEGTVRADWNPAFGFPVVPLVFLARLNGVAAIPFVLLYAVLAIGGEGAARLTGIPNHFTLVVVALVMLALAAMDRWRLDAA